MIRLQRRESGPYFTALSLRIPDMRAKICSRCSGVSLSNTQIRQALGHLRAGQNTHIVAPLWVIISTANVLFSLPASCCKACCCALGA